MKILDRVNERFLCFNAEQVDNVDEWSVLSKNALVEVYSSHDICLTGNVVSWANLTGLLSEFVPYVKVCVLNLVLQWEEGVPNKKQISVILTIYLV